MTIESVFEAITHIVLPLVLVVFIIVRQFMWQTIGERPLWRSGLILGIVGVVILASQPELRGETITTTDLAIVALELAVAFGVGLAMGQVSVFREVAGKIEYRLPMWGIVLWFMFLAVRIGLVVLADQSGAAIASASAFILVSLGVNRLARGIRVESRKPSASVQHPAAVLG